MFGLTSKLTLWLHVYLLKCMFEPTAVCLVLLNFLKKVKVLGKLWMSKVTFSALGSFLVFLPIKDFEEALLIFWVIEVISTRD